MSGDNGRLFGLSGAAKRRLIEKMRGKQGASERQASPISHSLGSQREEIPAEFYSVEALPGLKQLRIQQAAADKFGVENPYFRQHDGVASSTTRIAGREYLNFSSYNYLGLCGHPKVSQAAKNAIDQFGTSVSASRPVSGERPVHRALESGLARFHGTEDCIAFVSGHATNVTTLGCLFGRKDLIVHDALIHNSIIQGAILSGAKRLSFPHNDWEALGKILAEVRRNYERAIVIIEGLYSMEGDVPELPRFIELKQRHRTFLMVDEAHSLGVLGETGRGVAEHFCLKGADIDLVMGTLSKTLAGCGGYIAAKRALIENLKFTAPGFVYSVGIPPPVAAASLAALELMEQEPQRCARLRQLARSFFDLARAERLNVGRCQGYAVIPLVTGSSVLAAKLSNRLFGRGINVQPIIYPAVEERAARLRFFVNATHTEEQLARTVRIASEEYDRLRRNPVSKLF
jgi:8-amino-7-oxononanoate synthase